jgi:hypothetical protein
MHLDSFCPFHGIVTDERNSLVKSHNIHQLINSVLVWSGLCVCSDPQSLVQGLLCLSDTAFRQKICENWWQWKISWKKGTPHAKSCNYYSFMSGTLVIPFLVITPNSVNISVCPLMPDWVLRHCLTINLCLFYVCVTSLIFFVGNWRTTHKWSGGYSLWELGGLWLVTLTE